MLELNIEISIEKMGEEGFHPVSRVNLDELNDNVWMYQNNSHEIYFVVETNEKVKPIKYLNLISGETRGYTMDGGINVE